MLSRAFLNNPGDFLLSHAVARAVPSAPAGLTSVFGMGTGVDPADKVTGKPGRISDCEFRIANFALRNLKSLLETIVRLRLRSEERSEIRNGKEQEFSENRIVTKASHQISD